MKKIGFLSFGHWSASPYSQVRSASDALIQSIELAEAVEDLGADGAYFRVHHFAQQLASPFPLLWDHVYCDLRGGRHYYPFAHCSSRSIHSCNAAFRMSFLRPRDM